MVFTKRRIKIVGSLLFFTIIFSIFTSIIILFFNKSNSYNQVFYNKTLNYRQNFNEIYVPNKDVNISLNSSDEVYLGGIPIGIKIEKNESINKILNNQINRLSYKLDNISEATNTITTNNILGIGTLTYVDINKRFGALGHQIIKTSINNNFKIGNIYNSLIVSSDKSSQGKAGHLNGYIIEKNIIGDIDKNLHFGIYGTANEKLIKGLDKIKIGSKTEIKLGKAQIYTTIKGIKPKLYNIEIVKINNQSSPSIKSMIIRVIDKELIKETGGIVQGMSGSPIIQNGKLIGALTHVFLNDSKKGYGLFIDWMLAN